MHAVLVIEGFGKCLISVFSFFAFDMVGGYDKAGFLFVCLSSVEDLLHRLVADS